MSSSGNNIKVRLKAAITLDGKIAASGGDSKWITGAQARAHVHRLCNEHDAILVGINTVLADNPRLTVRDIPDGNSPIRVVLDSMARLPGDCHILNDDGVSVIVITGSDAPNRVWTDRKNLFVVEAPTRIPEIPWVKEQLGKQGIRSLFVEGGSLVHASFIKSGCVDQLYLFIAPKVIGGQQALSWCGELGCDLIADAVRWQVQSASEIGDDILLIASLKKHA